MQDHEITMFLKNSRGIGEDGANAIWESYFPKLMRVIENKLRNSPKRAVDSEDIAQNAMLSLFRGLQENKFDSVANRDELWALLVTITARKVTRERRRSLAKKRGEGTTRGESVFISAGSVDDNYGINQILDENQMPDSADRVLETYEKLLPEIGDEKTLNTIMLRMEGYTNREIAEKMECSVSRVEQRISKIRKAWQSELDLSVDES
jgi:RNA polymerase sigma factor (sigma-70 family)